MKNNVIKIGKYRIYLLSFLLFSFAGLFFVSHTFGKVEYSPINNQPLDERTKANVLSAFGKLPLHFVENKGQLPDEVVYYAKSEGGAVYCTDKGLVFGFAEGSISLKFSECENWSAKTLFSPKRVKPQARGELEGKVNYFIGNDPALWRTNIPTFAEVVYQDVYQGIDLVYSGNQRRLKYTFHLEPGADPNQINMIYDGIEGLSIDDDTSELVINTKWGEMRDAKPLAYQYIKGLRKEVSISFRLIDEKSIGFAVGDYDSKFSLTVDPGYSTYLGGSRGDDGYGIAVDGSGNVYVTGETYSSNFPTQNPYQGANGGNHDAFVTKLNSDGHTLSYSTYLGGWSEDGGHGIAVDVSENAYVTGYTSSLNFPTQNPYQGDFGGDVDAFVTKLNSDGHTLLYSTYLGGSIVDGGVGIAFDGSGSTYVMGYTSSSDFPTQNPYQGAFGGYYDAFVTKLNINGHTLSYSTYLGGDDYDSGRGIAVDVSGNAYVTGYTSSLNFPTQNPFQGAYGGGDDDAFVTKLNSDGHTLSYSTYLGGSSLDWGHGIAVDGSGNAYVTGRTGSSNFPTHNPFQGAFGGSVDAFVTKLSSNGQMLSYSTYLGGSSSDGGYGIAVNGSGNAYVTGYTGSSNFPTHNPFQGTNGGRSDAFVSSYLSDGSLLSDTTPPSAVTNLSIYSVKSDSVTLSWTAPGDNGNAGTATAYDIRYSKSPITDQNWGAATQCEGEPAPKPAGSSETFTVTGLSPNTVYYFAMKTADGIPNWSALSHLASSKTTNPPWDVNQDGRVDILDLVIIGQNFGSKITKPVTPNPDVNNDGMVDILDLVLVGQHFGESSPAAPALAWSASYQDVDFSQYLPLLQKLYAELLKNPSQGEEFIQTRLLLLKLIRLAGGEEVPKENRLLLNYPNPFNPETWIPYQLAGEAAVTIRIYDVNGRLVRELDLGKQKAGSYLEKQKAAYWDGKEQTGKAVSSGIYFYTLKVGAFQATRRMVILK